MGFTCILYTNTFIVDRYCDFKYYQQADISTSYTIVTGCDIWSKAHLLREQSDLRDMGYSL